MAASLRTLLSLQQAALPEAAAAISPRDRDRLTQATGNIGVGTEANAVLTFTMKHTLADREGFWIEALTGVISTSVTGFAIESGQLAWLDNANNLILPYGQVVFTTLVPGLGPLGYVFSPPFQPVSERDLEIFAHLAGFPGPLAQPAKLQLTVAFKNNGAATGTGTVTAHLLSRFIQGLREV